MYWIVTPETPNRQFTEIVRHTMALIDKTNEGGLRIEFNMPHGVMDVASLRRQARCDSV